MVSMAGGGATLVNASGNLQSLANSAWDGRNATPAFRNLLTPSQLRDVAYYISVELFPARTN